MELLETQDPEKRKLVEASERHKRELEREVTDITKKTERIVTNALIIGGALALTYFAVRQLSGKSKKKSAKKKAVQVVAADDDDNEEELAIASAGPSLISQIGTKIVDQATLMLLDIAREKLAEYLQNRKSNEPS
ncbi:MAG: hypothetical protein ACOYW3_05110 [Bacteroidota bacterium]